MRAAKTIVALAAALGLAGVGCGAAPDDGTVDEYTEVDENGGLIGLDSDQVDQEGYRALNGFRVMNGVSSVNGFLANNGLLSKNGLRNVNGYRTINGFASINGMKSLNGYRAVNGLRTLNGSTTIDGLPDYTVIPNRGDMMNSVAGRDTISYLIRCALRSDQFIERSDSNGVKYKFYGQIGLAENWDGAGDANICDLNCEEWVSACLMAHYNPEGKHINIGLVAKHPKIGWGRPDSTYDEIEAAWYGNLFFDPPKAYYCDMLGGGDRDGCVDNSSCVIDEVDDHCQSGTDRYVEATGVKQGDVAKFNSTTCKDGICNGTKLLGYNCYGDDCAAEYTNTITTWLTQGY